MKTNMIYLFVALTLSGVLFHSEGLAQRKSFGSTVLNSANLKPVSYATIQIKNTYQGTATNQNGNFSILVNVEDSLIVSCIGYSSLTISANELIDTIYLKEEVRVLNDITVIARELNARKLVKKAFRSIKKNYISEPLVMNTFYRHYCRDDSIYGRLIEAAVDVYKSKGYRKPKSQYFKKDYYRLVQARRSFDKSFVSGDHVPIAFDQMINSDVAAYQSSQKAEVPFMLFSSSGKHLKANLNEYKYELDKISYMDGKEIYEINYSMKQNDYLGESGMKFEIDHYGKFYIADESYALVKIESKLSLGFRFIEDQWIYTPADAGYYLSHLIHNQESINTSNKDSKNHIAHIELLVNNIELGKKPDFVHEPISEKVLSTNKYDPLFWKNYTVISENPLEKKIKKQLESAQNLEDQFITKSEKDYSNYEQLIQDIDSLRFLLTNSKDEIVYLDFWASWCNPCIAEFIKSNKVINEYANKGVRFIYVSIDQDAEKWNKIKTRFGLKDREHLRIGNESDLLVRYKVEEIPRYMMIYPDGKTLNYAPRPSSKEFRELIDLEIMQLNKVKSK